ncbi:uncharacterized protein [Nicotiana tomentosiformis]|uniref:uncharacterized protein n=1 Tax=Nicotiana tomentosiformis TaxID=4098 RepID=UPI00388CD502
MRDCPTRGDASLAQPTGSVASSSSSVQPPGQGSQAPMSHGRGRGGASSSRGPQNCIYALAGRQDQESSPDFVIGKLSVFSYDVYALIDPGSTLSYVTPLVASKFGIKPELVKHFEMSTPVGKSVVAKRIKDSPISISRGARFGVERCIRDPSRIMSVGDVQVTEQLSYEETPIAILDR